MQRKNGATSVIVRHKLYKASDGTAKTGLTSSSAGFIIGTIADVEATSTAYTQAGGTIESITTLGTYAAPTATKCRFKEVDATNHPGLYEFQFADARFAVSSGKNLIVSVPAVAGLDLAGTDFVVDLTTFDPYDGVRGNLTALPNANAEAAGGLFTRGTGAGQIEQEDNGKISINVKQWLRGTIPAVNVTGVPIIDLKYILGTALTETAGQIAAAFKKLFDVASPVFDMTSVKQTGDSYARLGAPAGASHAADVAAVKTDTAAVKTQTDKLTFTVANQIDANVLDWKSATAPAMTGDAFARLGAPAGASVSADIAAVNAKTTNLPGSPAAVGSAMTLTSGERDSVADALLNRNIAGGSSAGRLVKSALRKLRNKVAISGSTLTVYQEDDSTADHTETVTTGAGNPLTSVDPDT